MQPRRPLPKGNASFSQFAAGLSRKRTSSAGARFGQKRGMRAATATTFLVNGLFNACSIIRVKIRALVDVLIVYSFCRTFEQRRVSGTWPESFCQVNEPAANRYSETMATRSCHEWARDSLPIPASAKTIPSCPYPLPHRFRREIRDRIIQSTTTAVRMQTAARRSSTPRAFSAKGSRLSSHHHLDDSRPGDVPPLR